MPCDYHPLKNMRIRLEDGQPFLRTGNRTLLACLLESIMLPLDVVITNLET
jgi:hypothetical protein